MSTTSTNLVYPIPTDGGDSDVWGAELNTSLTTIDGLFDNSTGAAGARAKLGLGPTSQNLVGVKQLAFPSTQVPSADPNTLDDYEEGSWTPTLVGDTGASGQTYATQTGQYVKIGRKVSCWGSILLTTTGTLTGTFAVIGGLPYLPDSTETFAVGGLTVTAGLPTHYSANTYHYFGSNFVYLLLKKALNVGAFANCALIADVANGAHIDFNFEYMAAN